MKNGSKVIGNAEVENGIDISLRLVPGCIDFHEDNRLSHREESGRIPSPRGSSGEAEIWIFEA